MRDGGYISERDHDRIVSRVRRDLAKNGGVAGLEREGRKKRMASGLAPSLSSGGYDPELPSSAPGQLQSLMQAMTPPTQQGVTTSSPVFSVGGYDGMHPDNEPYGMHDEENLNWHQHAGYHGMHPLGGHDDNVDAQTPPLAGWTGQGNSSGPVNNWTAARAILSPPRGRAEYSNGQWTGGEEGHYPSPLESRIKRLRGGGYAAANSMEPMRSRFADLRGIHSQTHAGGYASDQGRQPVMVHEVHRTYTTDAPMGRLFDSAPGVSEGTVNRLRDALMGMFEDHR